MLRGTLSAELTGLIKSSLKQKSRLSVQRLFYQRQLLFEKTCTMQIIRYSKRHFSYEKEEIDTEESPTLTVRELEKDTKFLISGFKASQSSINEEYLTQLINTYKAILFFSTMVHITPDSIKYGFNTQIWGDESKKRRLESIAETLFTHKSQNMELLFNLVFYFDRILFPLWNQTALETLIQKNLSTASPGILLFFIRSLLIHSKNQPFFGEALNKIFEQYDQYREDPYHLGQLLIAYYHLAAKFYSEYNKLDFHSSAQHISRNFEDQFQSTLKITTVKPLLKRENVETVFQLITNDLMKSYQKQTTQNSNSPDPKQLLDQQLFFFGSFTKQRFQFPAYFEFFDKVLEKNSPQLSFNEMTEILLAYVKQFPYIPALMENYLTILPETIKTVQKAIIEGTGIRNVLYSDLWKFDKSLAFYQNTLGSDKKTQTPSNLPKPTKEFTLKNFADAFWILTRCYQPDNLWILQELNLMLNDLLNFYKIEELISILNSKCLLYIYGEYPIEEIENDVGPLLNLINEKLATLGDINYALKKKVSCSLYQNILFLKLKKPSIISGLKKYHIQTLQSIWDKFSLNRARQSKEENLIAACLKKILTKKNNISEEKLLKQSELIHPYYVDMLIAPNQVVEYNGEFHYFLDWKHQPLGKTFKGNFIMKKSILEMLGYNVFILSYKDVQPSKMKESELEEFLKDRLKEWNCLNK